MKPWIGVVPLWDEEKDSLWMLPGYMDGIRRAGGLPVMLPLTEDEAEIRELMDGLDGILLTGGQDVAPEVYGQVRMQVPLELCERRDIMERYMLTLALERHMPVLGICRGIQLMNACLGGTLYQDLPAQHPSQVCHSQKPPYDVPCHAVHLKAGSPLQALAGETEIWVNSCHHQAVRELAPALSVMAEAPDGIVEAAYMPAQPFVWAVQWHPECFALHDRVSSAIFAAFVNACRA